MLRVIERKHITTSAVTSDDGIFDLALETNDDDDDRRVLVIVICSELVCSAPPTLVDARRLVQL